MDMLQGQSNISTELSAFNGEEKISVLANSIYKSDALDNAFYKRWQTSRLNSKQLEIFADNYYHWIEPTTTRLAKAFVVTNDITSRIEILHNIKDELGGGHYDGVHLFVMRRWLDALLVKYADHTFQNLEAKNTELLPSTLLLTSKSLELCDRSTPSANGVILAQEWHAYTQFVFLYEGFRQYMHAYELDEFHDICEYLYIHIGWAEKEHKQQSIITATRCCHTQEDLNELTFGFNSFVNLLGNFWNGLYVELEKHE